jgi:hypothetical protein
MKREILYSAAVLLVAATALTGCNKESSSKTSEQQWTMNVEASKGGEATKALTLGTTTISGAWATTEKVAVMNSTNATYYGTLAPKTSGTASARLSGTLTGSFAVNDKLNLYFPSTAYVSGTGVVLDYTGQDGTMATIASKYDYSVASVTATTVDNASQSFETTAATFANKQAIAGFTFVDGTTPIKVLKMVISAASGKLVQKASLSSSTSYTYGSIVVIPALATTGKIYVALNNQNGALDTYTFYVMDGTGNWWTGTAKANLVAGKYYPATGIKLTSYPVKGTLNGHEWVMLRFGGTKWATHNVDLTTTNFETSNVSNFGTALAWGATSAGVLDTGVNSPSSDITATSNDVAWVKWGNGWKIPTSSEFDEIGSYSSSAGEYFWNGTTNGYYLSNVSDLGTGQIIFFPVQRTNADATNYWSSSFRDTETNQAFCFWFRESSNRRYITGDYCTKKYYVRPVVK